MIKLLMIVKNEAHTIQRTLDSVTALVDSYCVLDTGSTDGTKGIIERWGVKHGIVGHVAEGDFENYAQARNQCEYVAREHREQHKEPWNLWMDADDVYHGDPEFLRFLLERTNKSHNAVDLAQHWPTGTVMVPRILRSSTTWAWRGRVHEYVYPVDAPYARVGFPSHCLVHYPHPTGARRSRARWKRDLEWLELDLAESTSEPERQRIQFHIDATKGWLKASRTKYQRLMP